MKLISDIRSPEVASILNAGGVAIIRTDTLYGIVSRADNKSAVARIYELKGRDEVKSPIVLISDESDIFDSVSPRLHQLLQTVWPGKVSVIIPSQAAPLWIRRSNDSVAYRMPDDAQLRSLLEKTGPLIAPSANPQSLQPAVTIQQAIEYFGDAVDLYVDGGEVEDSTPSQLLRMSVSGEVDRLR